MAETEEAADISLGAPRVRSFRKSYSSVRLTSESLESQSRIALLAWNRLGADAAIAFLNTCDAGLEGRPLVLAVASTARFGAVEYATSALTGRH